MNYDIDEIAGKFFDSRYPDGPGYDEISEQDKEANRSVIRAVFDAMEALRDIGYAVVKTPDPTDYWSEGPEWRIIRKDLVVWTGIGSDQVMIQNVEPGELRAADARGLAAVLLAAADFAEGM